VQLITGGAGSAQPTNIIKIVNFDILVGYAGRYYAMCGACGGITDAPNYAAKCDRLKPIPCSR
jgi:hypothetical protein